MTKNDTPERDLESSMTDGARDPSLKSVISLMNITMPVEVVLGRASLPLSQLMGLSKGAVVELDRKIGDKVDIVVNGSVIAHGKLVSMNEGKIGVEMTEIVKDIVSQEP